MEKYIDDLNQKDFKLFKDLADTIHRHYPKGIRATDEEYFKSKEIKKVYEIIGENIGAPEDKPGKHSLLWRSLLKRLVSKASKLINGTTIGFVPGSAKNLFSCKKKHNKVSLINDYDNYPTSRESQS